MEFIRIRFLVAVLAGVALAAPLLPAFCEPAEAQAPCFGGAFATGRSFDVNDTPNSVVFADFNGDGRPDLAVTDASGFGATLDACEYSIMETDVELPAEGGWSSVGVDATEGCPWTAVSNDPSWLTVTSGLSGSGSGSVLFSAASNSGAARAGTIAIAGQTLTVTQPYEECVYSLDPTGASIAAAGGSGTVSATTNAPSCAWTAVSNAPNWLTVTSASSGSGNATVTYSVSANPGRARSGTLTIGGQTITWSQAAVSEDCYEQAFRVSGKHEVGGRPIFVVAGDFNEDGRTDLVTANYDEGTISVMLGTGSDGFGARTDLAVGSGPRSVAVGDFDADGHLDLAVTNTGSRSVSVLLGTGTGGFGAKTDLSVGSYPRDVVVADFNADGRLDLAVANANDGSVSVLLGTGTGSFGAKADLFLGVSRSPASLAVGDFNADGRLDLAVADELNDAVWVLLGTGTGSFAAPTSYDVGPWPVSVRAGDLNGDGHLDLVTANSDWQTVSVLLGTGTGSFGAHTEYQVGWYPSGLVLADLNGDGALDIATPGQLLDGTHVVTVLLGRGTGLFKARADYPVGGWLIALTGADLNGDGQIDLAVTETAPTDEPGPGFVWVLRNTSTCAIQLAVSRAGAGGGTVTSSPPAIECGSRCAELYPYGTAVTLMAEAAAGSAFTGWSGGGCAGTDACVVTMDAAQSVTATFDACAFSIDPTSASVAASGGLGSVSVGSNGQQCSWTAVSNDPSWLTVTSGSGGSGNGTVGFSAAVNVGAARSGTISIGGHTLVVEQASGCTYSIDPVGADVATGAGSGTVSVAASDAGCTWTAASGDGSWLTVTSGATGSGSGSAGYAFAANAGAARVGTLTIAGQTFTLRQAAARYVLTALKAGSGSGTVTSNPAGIACGPECAASWTAGTSVTLTAVAASGSAFVGWGGATCGAASVCTVVVGGDQTVTATFGSQSVALQFGAATYSVGEAASKATITVTRTGVTTSAVTVGYTTSNGTATAGSDYTAKTGTLTFAAGVTSKTFGIAILSDTLTESNETVNLKLSSPGAGAVLGTPATAVLTITDDDVPPALSIDDVSVAEGNSGTTTATFTVLLSPAPLQAVTVSYATANGSATAGSDYAALSGTLTFPAGRTFRRIMVAVTGDTVVEGDETYTVTLSNPVGATLARVQGTGTIQNDDAPPGVVTTEEVIWTAAVGVTASGNDLTKTAADGWGNAGAVSTRAIQSGDGYVEFVASETTSARMIGLSKGNTDASTADIDFAVRLSSGGALIVYEAGVLRGTFGTYATGDTVRIAVTGGVVRYLRKGVVLYSSTQTPRYPLLVDTSLRHPNATIQDVVLSGQLVDVN